MPPPKMAPLAMAVISLFEASDQVSSAPRNFLSIAMLRRAVRPSVPPSSPTAVANCRSKPPLPARIALSGSFSGMASDSAVITPYCVASCGRSPFSRPRAYASPYVCAPMIAKPVSARRVSMLAPTGITMLARLGTALPRMSSSEPGTTTTSAASSLMFLSLSWRRRLCSAAHLPTACLTSGIPSNMPGMS